MLSVEEIMNVKIKPVTKAEVRTYLRQLAELQIRGNRAILSVSKAHPGANGKMQGGCLDGAFPLAAIGEHWRVGCGWSSALSLQRSPVWTTNLPAPVVVNGQNTLTDPISGTLRFFRLSQ
jgi:hypothetical protein